MKGFVLIYFFFFFAKSEAYQGTEVAHHLIYCVRFSVIEILLFSTLACTFLPPFNQGFFLDSIPIKIKGHLLL